MRGCCCSITFPPWLVLEEQKGSPTKLGLHAASILEGKNEKEEHCLITDTSYVITSVPSRHFRFLPPVLE